MNIEKLAKGARFLPWLFCAALLAGCAHRYDMTLTNGEKLANVGKPVLHKDEGAYYYKDVAGNIHHINAGRVVEIAPHSNRNTTPGTLQ
jgi:hypothetical protein